jgi:hypothetical protein
MDPTKRDCLVPVKVGRMNPTHWTKRIGTGIEVQERGSTSIPGGTVKVRGAMTYEEWARKKRR